MSEAFRSGPDAAERIAADPFWSVVRRRHPDVDVVLLPPEPTPAAGPDETGEAPLVDADDEEQRQADEVSRWWHEVGGPAEPVAGGRWTSGEQHGTHRRETTWRADGVDPTAAVAALPRVAAALEADGWHVLAPDAGLPRVLAGHTTSHGRAELQVVLDPAAGRLVLRLRSADVVLRGGAPAGATP